MVSRFSMLQMTYNWFCVGFYLHIAQVNSGLSLEQERGPLTMIVLELCCGDSLGRGVVGSNTKLDMGPLLELDRLTNLFKKPQSALVWARVVRCGTVMIRSRLYSLITSSIVLFIPLTPPTWGTCNKKLKNWNIFIHIDYYCTRLYIQNETLEWGIIWCIHRIRGFQRCGWCETFQERTWSHNRTISGWGTKPTHHP